MKPRLFIASSVEGLSVAYAVQDNLDHEFEVTVWTQGVFDLSKTPLASLIAIADRIEAAAFVLSPDDQSIVRGGSRPAVRDNVLLELGLFIGKLGLERCFLLKPRSFSDLDFPSDLAGITPAPYNGDRTDGNWAAALGSASNKIRAAFSKELAPRSAPQKPTSRPSVIETMLVSQTFRLFFNPPNVSKSKRMRFEPGGRIVEGNNANEHSWRLMDGLLELVQLDGRVHSRFSFDSNSLTFKHTNDPDTRSIRNQFMVLDQPPHKPST